MQYLTAIFLIITFFEGLSLTLSAEPYCYKNITEISHKVVTKTRLKTVTKKGFFNKLAQKKETQVEVYEDYEPVHKIKVERICCDGYKLSELDMCEPQCIENGCPAHSKCVEPEVCECVRGYFSARSPADSKHYCEPICEKPCPEHSVCVAPNECACKKGYRITETHLCEPYCASGCPFDGLCVAPNKCQCLEGYKSEQGSCLPTCSLGDQCQNGECLGQELCLCNNGFKWNSQTLKCEISFTSFETSTYGTEITETVRDVASEMDMETDIDTDTDGIDPNQVFDEIISTTTYYPEDFLSSTSISKAHKCPDDFVYHKGECKPLKFVSNEIDCRFKPCQDKHAYCLENGTCTCQEGYQMFKIHMVDHDSLNYTIKAMCLTPTEYEARLQEQSKEQEEQEDPSTSWATIFFIVLGVLIMISALVFVSLKGLRPQSGHLDVEGKNLACSYDSRACTEPEKSVI